MKRIVSLLLSFQFSCLALPSTLRGGADGAGGDSLKAETGSAWFLGQENIKYCSVVDAKFGLAPEHVHPELMGVFRSWAVYVAAHLPPSSDISSDLALRSKFLATCDGTEDIKFYFGGTNEEIEKAKFNYENPVGFAHRTSYDIKKGWGKGFVWIAPTKSVLPKENFPNWSTPHLLYGILLHELGHVYGCGHVEGTIMSERIAELMKMGQGSPKLGTRFLTEVDSYRTLFPMGQSITKGMFGDPSKESETPSLYETLVGKKPVGKVTAEHIYNGEGLSHLRLFDDAGAVALPMRTNTEKEISGFSIYPGDGSVFVRVKENKEGVTSKEMTVSYGYSTLGVLKTISGKDIPITLEVNSLSFSSVNLDKFGGPLRIRAFIGDKVQDIFLQERTVLKK